MSAVWPNIAVTDDSLVQCVTEIRKALGDDRHVIIKTVPKRGYVFESGAQNETSPAGNSWTPFAFAIAAALALAALAVVQSPATESVHRQSIAVLPFENLSDDPQQAFFADGIAEDLLTDISRLSGVFVIARNSSFAYRGKGPDARTIARELGVRYVLERSVRRADGQVRITVQLGRRHSGSQQWAERYDGVYADIFALQDRVTKAVVEALAVELTGIEQTRAGSAATREFRQPTRHFYVDGNIIRKQHRRITRRRSHISNGQQNWTRTTDVPMPPSPWVYFRSYDQKWTGILGISTDRAFRTAQRYLKLVMARPTSTSHQVAGNISRERGWYLTTHSS